MRPTKNTTPAELKVLAFFVLSGLMGLGFLLVYLGISASPDKQEIADQVTRIGLGCIGSALVGFFAWKLIKRWL